MQSYFPFLCILNVVVIFYDIFWMFNFYGFYIALAPHFNIV